MSRSGRSSAGSGGPRPIARAAAGRRSPKEAAFRSPPELGRRPSERFLRLDAYRVEREWKRYEGTPQRDLFRILRRRFLARHARSNGWVVEIGPGPGRFTPEIGDARAHRVVLDLSGGMLEAVRRRWPKTGSGPVPSLLRGDARWPPLRDGRFDAVVALGNSVGFGGTDAPGLLDQIADLVAPNGRFVVEAVTGSGEVSRDLRRLPPNAVSRLLRGPVEMVLARLEREGFDPLPPRDPERHGFHRFTLRALVEALGRHRIEVTESMAVAPALGSEPTRIAAVARDPLAWEHL
ncbi:MAG TPA: class I SAM-dependent methyltransferase, partial [Thermoplasmata archaeon]|nr:class I SAM-dependent methyltransferase [Thermoplasmata archaeon]